MPDIETYRTWVDLWFHTLCFGWPARLLAASCLALAFWRGIYHQQFVLSALLYALTLLFTYVGAVSRWLSGG